MKALFGILMTVVLMTAASAANAGLCDRFADEPKIKARCEEKAKLAAERDSAKSSADAARGELAGYRREAADKKVERAEAMRALAALIMYRNNCGLCQRTNCVNVVGCIERVCYKCSDAKKNLKVVYAGLTRPQVAKMIAKAVAGLPTFEDLKAMEDALNARIGELEGRVSALEELIPKLEARIAELERQVKELTDKVAKLEGQIAFILEEIAKLKAKDIEQDREIAKKPEIDWRVGVGGVATSVDVVAGVVSVAMEIQKDKLVGTLEGGLGYSSDQRWTFYGAAGLGGAVGEHVVIGGEVMYLHETAEDDADIAMLVGPNLRFKTDTGGKADFFFNVFAGFGAGSCDWEADPVNREDDRVWEFAFGGMLTLGVEF